MMNNAPWNVQHFEALEGYVLGTMSALERARFEEELEHNAPLRAEVEQLRESILAVEMGGVHRALLQLKEEHRTSTDRHWTHVLKYVAAAVVLLGIALWYVSRPTANEQLFADFFVADPGLPVAMGAAEDHAFHDAMVAYKLGDFQEASDRWSALLRNDPVNDTLRFYIAAAALAQNEAVAAMPMLKTVADDSTSSFAIKARWYLFLAHVRAGEVAQAKAIALEGDPTYGERVRAIKQQL